MNDLAWSPIWIGRLIALIVLFVAIVLLIVDDPLEKKHILGLIAALAVARLVP